ncbi:MAG: hypothetical protein Q4F10_06275 [Corynebacterium glutamicum]|nr:hypothetical protein [Corynebacterium glutamicum]
MSLPIENHVKISSSGKITIDGREVLVEKGSVNIIGAGSDDSELTMLRLTLVPASITLENDDAE